MRADLALRHERTERVHVADNYLVGPPLAPDPRPQAAGGDVTSLAFNWAFRPRPTLDFQLEVEHPIDQHVHGRDLEAGTTVAFRFGYSSGGNLCRSIASVSDMTTIELRTPLGRSKLLLRFTAEMLKPDTLRAWGDLGPLFLRGAA